MIAYKPEGSPATEPGEAYDPDAPIPDANDDEEDEDETEDETETYEKPRFRNARRTPALYKVRYDAPSSFVAAGAAGAGALAAGADAEKQRCQVRLPVKRRQLQLRKRVPHRRWLRWLLLRLPVQARPHAVKRGLCRVAVARRHGAHWGGLAVRAAVQ